MSNYSNYVIKDKTVGVHFGLPAVRRINEVTFSITDENGYYNNLGVAHIVYAGYLNWCMVKEMVPLLAFEDFYTEIEEGFFTQDQDDRWKQGIDAVTLYSESFVVKSLLEQQKKRTLQTNQQTTQSPTTENPSSNLNQDQTPSNIGTGSNSSVSDSSE